MRTGKPRQYFEKGENVVNFLFDYKVPRGYNNVKGCQMTRFINRDGGEILAYNVRHPSTAAAP